MSDFVDIIPTSDYPPVLPQPAATEFARYIRGEDMQRRLGFVMSTRRVEFAEAVRKSAGRMQIAARAGDLEDVFAEAHEIRGLAQTGGLTASGIIADRLCLYLHMARALGKIDHGLVGLHVGAIARAAHASDEATRLGSAVAEELAALTARKLGSTPPRFR